MINCTKAEQLMSDFVLGLTNKEDTLDIEDHLKECEKCRKNYEMLKDTAKTIDAIPEDEPFKKVKKVIDTQKKKKWIALIIAVISVIVFMIIVLGELFPKTGLPSITRFSYRLKAKSLVEDFFNNNMEVLLLGATNRTAGTTGYSYTKSSNVINMFNDYSGQLNSIYDQYIAGKDYTIKSSKIKYEESSSYSYMIDPENRYSDHLCYTVTVTVEIGDMEFDMLFSFYNPADYDVFFSFDRDSASFNIGIEKAYKLINHFYRYVLDVDYTHYILNEIMTDPLESANIGQGIFTLVNDEDKETYTIKLNERLNEIKKISKTESIDMQVRDYCFDAHALGIQMIWQLEDSTGHKAVAFINFLYDTEGYHKTDDNIKIISEDGFDASLTEKLKTLF